MSKFLLIGLVGCVFGLFSFDFFEENEPLISYPTDWPEPVYDFAKNPITEEGFQLGRTLFYDPNLSRDQTISCASCHLQYTGFTHVDHAVSHGIEGRKGTRNSLVLINLAWNSSFHWDGGVNHLDVQGINPIQHPAEMDNSLEKVLAYVNQSEIYRGMFFDAYGDSLATTKTLLQSFSQFTTSLISSNSKYDQFMRGETELTEQENRGHKLFQQHCNGCHTAPLFNSNKFASNGLPIDSLYNDVGRYAITHVGSDSMQFRIPTLRNIEHTFPYMHDGRFKRLKDVVRYYAEELNHDARYLHKDLKREISLDEYAQKDLISFLYTLTDRTFLYNPKFSYPR